MTGFFLLFIALYLAFASTEVFGRHDLFYLPIYDEDDR